MSKLPRRAFLTALGLTLAAQPAEAGVFGLFRRRRCRPILRPRCYCPPVEYCCPPQTVGAPMGCTPGTICIDDELYEVKDNSGNVLFRVYRAVKCPSENMTLFSLNELNYLPQKCNPCGDTMGGPCYLEPFSTQPIPFPRPRGLAKMGRVHLMMKKRLPSGKDDNFDLFEDGISSFGVKNNAPANHFTLKYMVGGSLRSFQLVWKSADETGIGYQIPDQATTDITSVVAESTFEYTPGQPFQNARSVIVNLPGIGQKPFLLVMKG